MMGKPTYIPFFLDDLDALEPLGDAERGRLFTALLEYGKTGAAKELSGNERFLYPSFKGRIDRFYQSYDKTCEKNRKNVKKRYDRIPNLPLYTTESNDNDRIPNLPSEEEYNPNTNPNTNPKKNNTVTRFVKPTAEEVRAYCQERHNAIDAESFIDFYESKGWKIGKEPMKDWQAAVRTWEKRRSPQQQKHKSWAEIAEQMDEEDRLKAGGENNDA